MYLGDLTQSISFSLCVLSGEKNYDLLAPSFV